MELALDSLPRSTSSSSCTSFPKSNSVMQNFGTSKTNYQMCSFYLRQIAGNTTALSSRFTTVNRVVGVVKPIVNTLTNTVKNVYNAANAILSKFTSIPKVGQIIQLALRIFQVVKAVLERVNSVINKVATLFGKLVIAFRTVSLTMNGLVTSSDAAAASSGLAATVTQLSMACTAKTITCTDDQAVEAENSKIDPSIAQAATYSATCPNVLGAIAKTLHDIVSALKESIFRAIEAAARQLERVLKPIIEMVEKAVNEVTQKFKEVYCCLTSQHLQTGLKFISQVLDLVTCPLNGAVAGIEAAMVLLENEMNKLINQILRKLLQPVANIEITYPDIAPGSVNSEQCAITYPGVVIKKVKPFQPWLDALQGDNPSTAVISHVALAFGQEIVNACKDAANELGKKLNQDCCIDYKPLSDGTGCDPTNLIPYTKCSQCVSGKSTWWFSKSKIACGQSPCGNDGARCGVGTTCKNCCSKHHSYWFKHAFTACGTEPCWNDGLRCGIGTSCNKCCNGHSWWPSKFFTACGRDPCWKDGTRCGAGTTCKKCCSGRFQHWYTVGMTACGNEPCWGGGRRCAAGTSCKRCCNGSKWVWKKVGHFCK